MVAIKQEVRMDVRLDLWLWAGRSHRTPEPDPA